MHYLLIYELVDDYISRRAEFRNAHLERAWASADRGELVLGGALADQAMLLFSANSPIAANSSRRLIRMS